VIVNEPQNWHFWITYLIMDTLNPAAYPNTVTYSYYLPGQRPEFDALYARFNTAAPSEFSAIADAIQLNMYENVPLLHFGGFKGAEAWTAELQGFTVWRVDRFWNCWLEG
jgi:hypothetical protein